MQQLRQNSRKLSATTRAFTLVLNCIYTALVVLMFPVVMWKRWTTGKYKSGWREKFTGRVQVRTSDDAPLLWLHAVSVGEVLQLRQIIAGLRQKQPELQIFISTTTETGHQVACEKFKDCQVGFFPLDFTWAVKTALNRVRPDLIVLVELELWPNFIIEADRRGIPLTLVNGRLSEKSFHGYQKISWIIGQLLKRFQRFAVQTSEYGERFTTLGAKSTDVVVTGSIKFDGVITDRQNPKTLELQEWLKLESHERVWVAGSTQDPEEILVVEIYEKLKLDVPDLRLIIVPRHPERGTVLCDMLRARNHLVVRRSKGDLVVNSTHQEIGLLDTVGELGGCWGLADIAFVGGSFGNRGGQNMLEPAAFGSAVCYGPNTKNFRQIVEILESSQATQRVNSPAELEEFVRRMLTHPADAQRLGTHARTVVLKQQGATQVTVSLILEELKPQRGC